MQQILQGTKKIKKRERKWSIDLVLIREERICKGLQEIGTIGKSKIPAFQ